MKAPFPLGFWYCSIGGSIVLLTYAIHRQDPVFIVGQSPLGFIIYIRNLILIDRKKKVFAGQGQRNEHLKFKKPLFPFFLWLFLLPPIFYGWLIKFNTKRLQILVVSYLHSTKPLGFAVTASPLNF
ncbi:MAG: hypothetical protein Ct9H300mP23_07370 [Nitrospinota bacterium]|nr:MAG: hypothetical protein Ct9H300mP23_07370 [Nitrospinota bacterium]